MDIQIIMQPQSAPLTPKPSRSQDMLNRLWELYDNDLLSEQEYRSAIDKVKLGMLRVQKRMLTLERRLVAKKLGAGEITLAQAMTAYADQVKRGWKL